METPERAASSRSGQCTNVASWHFASRDHSRGVVMEFFSERCPCAHIYLSRLAIFLVEE